MLKDMVDGPPLPQAMRIKNKGVLRVGVPSMQDLQKWAEQSQSSEDHKQLTLETFEAAPQWLAERRVNVKWKPVSVSSDMERKSSIFFASATDKCEPSSSAFEWRTEGSTKPISAYKFNSKATYSTPTTICGRRNSICRLHKSGWQVTSYPYFEEKEKRWNRSKLDYGLDFGFLQRKQVITDRFWAGIHMVPGRQHNGQHLVRNYMHYKSCVVVAGKSNVRSTRGSKWEWLHMDHDRNKVRCIQKTDIDHVLWW